MIESRKQTLSAWSGNKVNWFVLFVRTGDEEGIAERLNQILDSERFHVFVPTRAYTFKEKGNKTIRYDRWFKSYVFVATTECAEECTKMVEPLMKNDPTIFKFVSYDGYEGIAALSEVDKSLLVGMMNEDFKVPPLKVIVVDGKYKPVANPFENINAVIVKYNQNMQYAVVEIPLFSDLIKTEIALEIGVSEKNVHDVLKHEKTRGRDK